MKAARKYTNPDDMPRLFITEPRRPLRREAVGPFRIAPGMLRPVRKPVRNPFWPVRVTPLPPRPDAPPAPTPVDHATPRPLLNLVDVVHRVCAVMNLEPADLQIRQCRHWRLVLARHLITYVARRRTAASFPEIAAEAFGRESHSAAFEGLRSFEGRLKGFWRWRHPDSMRWVELVMYEFGMTGDPDKDNWRI